MSNPAEQDFSDTMPRRSTIVIWLAVTIVLLAAVVGLLGYRALTVREPQAAVTIQGTEAWADADAVLLSGSGTRISETKLDASGRFGATFFVEPGSYRLQLRREGRTIYDRSIDLVKGKPESIVLPATQPATAPTAPTAPTSSTAP